jgi:hypothetical protein
MLNLECTIARSGSLYSYYTLTPRRSNPGTAKTFRSVSDHFCYYNAPGKKEEKRKKNNEKAVMKN